MQVLSQAQELAARDNRAFYIGAMFPEMNERPFRDVAYLAQHQPSEHKFEREGFATCVVIDATALHKVESFVSDFHRALVRVKNASFGGDLNDEVRIEKGSYRLEFRITGYRRKKYPSEGYVEDPTTLPLGEELSRRVELKVDFAT